MVEITATEASKGFSDMLDAVEHRGESFTITRNGHVVATVQPAERKRWSFAELVDFFRENPPDESWADDMEKVREWVGNDLPRDPWSE